MGSFGAGHVLLLIAAALLVIAAVRSARPMRPGRPSRPVDPPCAPAPPRLGPRVPPDPLLDTDLDPLVEPWSDDPPTRH